MKSIHLIRTQQIPLPRRLDSEPAWLHEARCRSIRKLGRNWVHHPAYTPNPRHSNDAAVYAPARAAYLAQVAALGAAAREKNPEYRRAQARAALAGADFAAAEPTPQAIFLRQGQA